MNILIITKIEAGERVDALLTKKFPEFSRNYFANLIKDNQIIVNGLVMKPSYCVKEDDKIEINFPEVISHELIPQDIHLDILYEDENVLVINKQAGISVHPGAGNPQGTIVNALLKHFPQIKNAVFEKGNPISEQRPGIVHRLDKDTSGVMIIAKNDRTIHSLSRQIENRSVQKIYMALCYGWPKNEHGTLTNYLGRHPINRKMVAEVGKEKGKVAISDYKVDSYFQIGNSKVSLIKFEIHTGRTHQIRVQSKIMGTPVVGDDVYGTKESMKVSHQLGVKRQLLHAHKLTITLPDEKRPRTFTAPMPSDFSETLIQLKKIS